VSDVDINQAAVDRLVERAGAVIGRGQVRSAFSGTRGLAPVAVAGVAAVPATVIIILALVLAKPVLLVFAVAAMALTMVVIMTRVNATRVVVEVRSELVVLAAHRGELSVLTRLPRPLVVEPGGGNSWLRVRADQELLWVSRPAFGGIVSRLAESDPDPDSESDSA
jgi:hypothetical protein